jgi:hypothetical protein
MEEPTAGVGREDKLIGAFAAAGVSQASSP